MRDSTRERFHELIDRATVVFAARGYRGTKIADVARALGVSEPAVYRYVESKEALFDQVVRRAATPSAPPEPGSLPVPTPPPGATLAYLRAALERSSRIAALEPGEATSGQAPTIDLRAIVEQLYDSAATHRVGLKIVERSALDWPELAMLWFGELRAGLVERLASVLQAGARAGALRKVSEPRASARMILEVIAYFAVHRHSDPFPTAMDEATARRTAIDDLVATFARDPERGARR